MNNKCKKSEYGAVTIVEATFVFPIMFFVLFFLLFYGNSCYVKSNIDAVVSKYATEAAAEIADPLLANLKENKVVGVYNPDSKPYRYMSSGYANTVVSKYKNKIEKEIKFSGFFSNMSPRSVQCKAEYKNYFLYQTVRYDVTYNIQIPIRIIFFENPTIMKFCSAEEVPVCDSSELILNTNMVIDYVEKTGLADKINDLKSKVSNFFEK